MYSQKLVELEDYEPFVGHRAIERIRKKARSLQHLRVAHINSTYYGGGVAEILTPLTLLMNNLGIKTGWRIIHGPPDFFSITKKMHNALQGGKINLSDRKIRCQPISLWWCRFPVSTGGKIRRE
jgi:trehalose synthase